MFYEYLYQREYNPLAEEKKKWTSWIQTQLGPEYLYVCPEMPNKYMANYPARKIWFEKLFPYLNDEGGG